MKTISTLKAMDESRLKNLVDKIYFLNFRLSGADRCFRIADFRRNRTVRLDESRLKNLVNKLYFLNFRLSRVDRFDFAYKVDEAYIFKISSNFIINFFCFKRHLNN